MHNNQDIITFLSPINLQTDILDFIGRREHINTIRMKTTVFMKKTFS